MPDFEEAVLVKAHLRRTGKKRGGSINLTDLFAICVLGIIFGVAFYLFYQWARSGGWVILVGGLAITLTVYSLIRWRKHIFTSSDPPNRQGWHTIKSTKDYPLWLIHSLYNLRYKQGIRRSIYTINGKAWQYRIELSDPFMPEPSATMNGLKISKKRR